MILKDGEEATSDGLIEHVKEHLARFKAPKSVAIVDELPVSSAGKVLRRAVESLDPMLRETIALHYFQGLSFREAGAVLDVPAGTVKSRVHRALGCLHALLEEREAEHGHERTEDATAGHR